MQAFHIVCLCDAEKAGKEILQVKIRLQQAPQQRPNSKHHLHRFSTYSTLVWEGVGVEMLLCPLRSSIPSLLVALGSTQCPRNRSRVERGGELSAKTLLSVKPAVLMEKEDQSTRRARNNCVSLTPAICLSV